MRTLIALTAAAALCASAGAATAQTLAVKKEATAEKAGVCFTAATLMKIMVENGSDGSEDDKQLLASTQAAVNAWDNYINGKGGSFTNAARTAAANKATGYQKMMEGQDGVTTVLKDALNEHADCLNYL